ncbi:MAG TPA: N-formylglutamate amidohydrolase [Hyphomicrobiaceae bacterium]|nr:N-formylglutamate amidohydrolase [Hyphomicrobiaceae bacterium]
MPANERASILAELTPPFAVYRPVRQTTPFVFCSPHSGRIYPRALREASRLDALTLRKSEDCYVDLLFDWVPEIGAPLLVAHFPRAYLDVNRDEGELDPELFIERVPVNAQTQSLRVSGGLGVIARIVADSEEIYRERFPLAVATERIERLYRPFHSALDALLRDTVARFGYAVLIDCHSMPSASTGPHGPARPDIVLGDRFGAAADARLVRLARDSLIALGYDVQLNRPYAGGYITEKYGRPSTGLHALQIELNRGLYLDETNLTPVTGFSELRGYLRSFAVKLIESTEAHFGRRQAAE